MYDKSGVKKGIHGDNKSDKKGYKAKINIGADGNYIELAENSLYKGSSVEQGKDNKFHKNAQSWDYYVKTIKSDGNYFDVLINVKDTGNEHYVYDITLKDDFEDYTVDELNKLSEDFVKYHDKYCLGVCVEKSLHMLFHKMYGDINDEEQWNLFVKKFNKGEILH